MGTRVRLAWVAASFATAVSALLVAPAHAAGALDDARATIAASRSTLLSKFDAAKANSDDAYDIVYRIDAAMESLDPARATADPVYAAETTLRVHLDAIWVAAVTSGACPAPATAGASESCFRATSDKTLQPLAIYVPATRPPSAAAPLVVMLRGRGETESDILSRSDIRALAEGSGAIVVAPYARGQARYDARATQDVLDALDAAQRSFSIDGRRVYIAGYSMGGIAAFHVAAAASDRFTAILSVVGALEPADRAGMRHFGSKPVYVVNAQHDEYIPAAAGQASVNYLRGVGIPTMYYESAGTHALRSVAPAMTQAWHDMFAGVIVAPDAQRSAPAPFPAGLPNPARPS